MQAEWEAVLHIHSCTGASSSSLSGAACVETGFVTTLHGRVSESVALQLHPSGETRMVNIPWSDRPEYFDTFVRESFDVLRLGLTLVDGRLTKYTLFVHSARFATEMATHGTVPGEIAALAFLRHHCLDAHLPRLARHTDPVHPVEVMAVPDGWTPALPLYETQRHSVAWMRGVERAIESGENTLRYEGLVPLGQSTWSYDVAHECFSQRPLLLKARFKGGVVTDSMGSGKTAAVLALVAAQRREEREAEPVCMMMPCSRATLIVVPMNLPQQWLDEVHKFTGDRLNTLMMCHARDTKQVSLAQVMRADLIITTTNFLRSKTYTDSLDELLRDLFGPLSKERRRDGALLRAAARALLVRDKLASAFPHLELCTYRRIILDEVHELFLPNAAARERLRTVRTLHGRVVFGLTATPCLMRSEDVQNFYFFLSPKTIDDGPHSHHHHPCLQSAVEQFLLHTASEGARTYADVLHSVRMTHQERALFDSFTVLSDEERIRWMCDITAGCERMTSGTIDDVTTVVQDDRVRQLQELGGAIHDAEVAIVRGEQGAAARIVTLEQRITQVRASLHFVHERLETLRAATEECPVCMTNPPTCISGPCGHLLCTECKCTLAKSGSFPCPICRVLVSDTEVFEVASPCAVPLLGSKLMAVAEKAEEQVKLGEKVLVFSQWKPPAQRLLAYLTEQGVATDLLDGNTTRRALVLRRFREATDARILLLLLDKSSAGIHLACATQCIFVHALTGPGAQAMEAQAIARAARAGQTRAVTVHHFIYENSAEATVWAQRHPSGRW